MEGNAEIKELAKKFIDAAGISNLPEKRALQMRSDTIHVKNNGTTEGGIPIGQEAVVTSGRRETPVLYFIKTTLCALKFLHFVI